MTERVATRFLRLALKRAARGGGSQEDLYYRRTSVQEIPDLESVLDSLRWALVGGIALRAYAPERMTLDVDIVVHERDEAAREAFVEAGYEVVGELSIGGFTAREAPDAVPVDAISRVDPWLEDALADVQRLLAGTPPAERASTRRLVEAHAPDLVEDYDSLVTLADLEFGPPREGQP